MLARTKWVALPVAVTATREAKKPRRLGDGRRQGIVENVVALMRASVERGAPSKFALEATCRTAIRSSLCLEGWAWGEADIAAMDVVAAALARIGAVRPTWQQGQPEWIQDGVLATERSRCVNCGRPLPEGRPKFCSNLCKRVHHADLARQHELEGDAAYDAIARKALRWSNPLSGV